MDEESLTHLLKGGHYTVPERKARGIWPHPPLRMADVRAHLIQLLATCRWFPAPVDPHNELQLEGIVAIERRDNAQWIVHLDDHYRRFEKAFTSADAAADFWLRWALHLPGDLDSWKVVDDSAGGNGDASS